MYHLDARIQTTLAREHAERLRQTMHAGRRDQASIGTVSMRTMSIRAGRAKSPPRAAESSAASSARLSETARCAR
jgi:hypothetical protein